MDQENKGFPLKTRGIPGFEMYDERGSKIADNPIKAHTKGRRAYGEDGQRIWAVDREERTRAKFHSYLIRIPNGAWKAFDMKCERNGLSKIQAIRTLMKLWTNGTIDMDLRLYLK